ncbi:MAG: ferritin family protein [Candidatus Cloacimonetes bacterium]|nr:ferritin family protein [Candidatus Cloacimonadota bacterium]
MRELSLNEIIEYAEKIELESYTFYSKAKEIIFDEEVKDLLTQLANDETDHYNHLRNLRQKGALTQKELDQKISLDIDLFSAIVNTEKIEKDFTSSEVLNIALQREINTEQTYAMLMTLTQLNDNVLKIFELLRKQEKGHVIKIQNRLNG